MAEGARLESVYTATYRGFESLPHRHIQRKSLYASTGFFAFISRRPGRDEKPRPGFDHWRSQGDSLRATRADCPQGEAQRAESIPPSPPYSKKKPELTLRLFCFFIAPGKRQVRSAYLPYKTCRRVGKRQRTHQLPVRDIFVRWVSASAPTTPARRQVPTG